MMIEDIIKLVVDNGIALGCVIYLIYFQNNTMTKMLDALNSINVRLSVIETKVDDKKEEV